MKLVMIKKAGCMPCKQFEPFAKQEAEKNSISFKTIMKEDMPEETHPPFFPYFYLYHDKEFMESWGGVNERKLLSALKRNLKKIKN